ncbi:MAG: hypothetical protein VW039_11090, partial [Halieaceae bacterium]
MVAPTIQALFHRTMYWLYTRRRVDADYSALTIICTPPFLNAVAIHEMSAISQMAHEALCDLMIQDVCLIAARPRHMSS